MASIFGGNPKNFWWVFGTHWRWHRPVDQKYEGLDEEHLCFLLRTYCPQLKDFAPLYGSMSFPSYRALPQHCRSQVTATVFQDDEHHYATNWRCWCKAFYPRRLCFSAGNQYDENKKSIAASPKSRTENVEYLRKQTRKPIECGFGIFRNRFMCLSNRF